MNARLDDAARAGWLYFVAGHTQDDIARKLGVSRQTAQRLVSTAVNEKLVKVSIEHPIARCMTLARDLTERFALSSCEVAPSDPDGANPDLGIAHTAAREMARWLASPTPVTMALGTGRTLRAAVDQLPPMDCGQHKLVSLVGNISADGSASFYDVISQMAGRVKAPHYPMTLPVIAHSREEREILASLATVKAVVRLAREADVAFVGVGQMDRDAPLRQDRFVQAEELNALIAAGAVGEIVGWTFDVTGKLVGPTNERVASVPILQGMARPTIGIAGGQRKLRAIAAALESRLLNGLITDEITAEALLKVPRAPPD